MHAYFSIYYLLLAFKDHVQVTIFYYFIFSLNVYAYVAKQTKQFMCVQVLFPIVSVRLHLYVSSI